MISSVRKYSGGALPSNSLIGMCSWMGSHFHDWIEYNEVAFSIELLEWGRIFSGFGGRIFWQVVSLGEKYRKICGTKMRIKYVFSRDCVLYSF